MSVPSSNALPVVSSGTVAASGGATTVPVIPASQVNQDLTGTINSPYVSTNGTTSATLTTTQSQGTPGGKGQFGLSTAPSSGIGINPNASSGIGINPTPKQTVGVSTPVDDGTTPNTNTVQTTVNNQFSGAIYPEPNVLDQFASYSYSLSLYLLSAEDARAAISSGSRNIANWKLLIQSGGIPTTDRFSTDPANQVFSNDFYLDNLEIKSSTTLGGTRAAHSAFEMQFTITEPNGITLVQNLWQAADQLYKQTGAAGYVNYIDSLYCMVIRFYGYDQDGKLAVPIKGGLVNQSSQGGTSTAGTDNKVVIEKFFPIRFTELTFRNVKKQVEYTIKAAPLGQVVGFGQARGTVPFPVNLSGETVGQVLNGKSATVTNANGTTDGRESTSTPTPANTPSQPFATSGIPTVNTNNPVTIAPTTPTLVGP